MDAVTIDRDLTMNDGVRAALLANRYRVVRHLGQGGMGSVWLAEDTQLDGKLFAVKMLPSILVSNKRAYSQLKAEALVSMKLTHPNIVTLRAFEENNGNPFLVMDYVDGQMLDDYLADRMAGGAPAVRVVPAAPRRPEDKPPCQNALPSEEDVVSLLRPIAEALDYAHREGVVHRDVKPANVMIRKDGHPVVLDFGIAREIQETMTRVTGKLSSGTLLYMSPEQLNGDAPKASQDVYSFAAMVYECLTGHPPFYRGAIEDQIKNKEPEPLSAASGRPFSIASSVMAGLAKRPEARVGNCLAVLSGQSVQKKSGAAKRTGLLTGVAAVLSVAALLGGVSWYRAVREENARIAAAEEAKRRAAEEAESRRLAAEEAESRRLAAEEAESRRLAAEEAKRRTAEEEESRRLAAEEAKRRTAEEAESRRLAEEESERRRLASEEAKRLAEEKAQRQQEEMALAAARLQEESRIRAENLAQAQKAEAREKARRHAEAKRRAEEEEKRLEAEREAKRKADAEASAYSALATAGVRRPSDSPRPVTAKPRKRRILSQKEESTRLALSAFAVGNWSLGYANAKSADQENPEIHRWLGRCYDPCVLTPGLRVDKDLALSGAHYRRADELENKERNR